MDLRKIKKLIELAKDSDVAELEVKSGDEVVRIVRFGSSGLAPQHDEQPAPAQAAPSPAPAVKGSRVTVKAPMAGVFYAAPSPGAAPFVQVGVAVASGDILCIIESMKMMNEIAAESPGRIAEILVADAEPVDTGQALFRIV